jgi:NFACT protein C-terminal domain/NFACT protein RNA binding domain
LKELVNAEREKGNELAKYIVGWKLETGKVVLELPNPNYDTDESSAEESETDKDVGADEDTEPTADSKTIDIDIDITITAYANARLYFDKKKSAEATATKAITASSAALEKAARKIGQDLAKKVSLAPTATVVRKEEWFEKFYWFISIDNTLVIASRDPFQAGLIISNYFVEGDVLVHSDTKDAPVVICKTMPDSPPVSPSTLSQASTMCACLSTAWETKETSASYYVNFNQVSRTKEQTGGQFTVTGKKNHLAPSPLVYGVALLFEVDAESSKRHHLDRRPWLRDGSVTPTGTGTEGEKNLYNTHLNEEISNRTEEEGDEDFDFPDTQLQAVDTAPTAEIHTSQPAARSPALEKGVSSTEVSPKSSPKGSVKQLPRGKKGKEKKIKGKYANQDEETRSLMIHLLAADKGPQPKGKKGKAKLARDADLELGEKGIDEDEAKNLNGPSKCTKGKGGKDAGKRKQAYIPKPPADEGPLTMDYIDLLTGLPRSEDTLIHCIPVCAPWSSLLKYNYKLKLVPGGLKRGKAAKLAAEALCKTVENEKNETEFECVRAVPHDEWIRGCIPKARVLWSDKGKK